MRKRIVIEIDVPVYDEKRIGSKIAYAAMKVIRANRGILIGINQQDIERVPNVWECFIEGETK